MASNFPDPRRPRNRAMDLVLGQSGRYPYTGPDGEDDYGAMYSAPPPQQSPSEPPGTPSNTTPLRPLPGTGNPGAGEPEMGQPSTPLRSTPPDDMPRRAEYEQVLGQPQSVDPRSPWWKQALGYGVRAFGGPLAGTDIPERLIIGDQNLKEQHRRQVQLAASGALTASEDARRKASTENRQTTTGEREVGTREQHAGTEAARLGWEKETYPTDTQIQILRAGGTPEGGKLTTPSGAPGVESTYTFPSPDWNLSPNMQQELGVPSVPRTAAGQAINAATQPHYRSGGSGVVFDERSGKPTFVKPFEPQRPMPVKPGQPILGPGGGYTHAPGEWKEPGVDPVEKATQRYNDDVMSAKNQLTSDIVKKIDQQVAADAFNETIQQARANYFAEAGPNAPPPPNPGAASITPGKKGFLWDDASSIDIPRAGGPPIGATSPANALPIGQTTPSGNPPGNPPVSTAPATARAPQANPQKPPQGHEIVKDGVRYRWNGTVYVEVM